MRLLWVILLFLNFSFTNVKGQAPPPCGLSPINVCDDDFDGQVVVNLREAFPFNFCNIDPALESEYQPLSYYLSLEDANNETNVIADPENFMTTQSVEVFRRADPITTTPFGVLIASDELILGIQPTPNPNAPDLEVCDDDGDGFSVFDLTVNDVLIITGQANVVVSYYENETDANNDVNVIIDPTSYNNVVAFQQTVYVRVESEITGCFTIVDFQIVVSPSPVLSINDISICDGGSAIVDTGLNPSEYIFLWSFNNNVLPDQGPSLTVTEEGFYTVEAMDISGGCSVSDGFNVIFENNIQFNEPSPLIACNPDGLGIADFDLSSTIAQITDGFSDLNVGFYQNQADADAAVNPIPGTLYANTTPFNDVLYARIDDNTSDCYAVATVELIVYGVAPLPVVSEFIVCDDDMDGFAAFDLTLKDQEILEGQNNFDHSVTYHLTQSDADNGINAINSPFINTSNPQTIYAAVTDVNSCNVQTASFDLIADQTCMPCQDINASIDSTVPAINESEIVVAQANTDITFNGSASFSVDGTNATYNWDFGDTNFASGTSVTHQFAQEGSYFVTLTVTDDNPEGCSDSISIQVLVVGDFLVVDQSQFTVEELVQNVLIGNDCSSVSDIISSTGTSFGPNEPNGIGYFVYEGTDFPFSEGLVLTTGNASNAEGPEESTLSDGSTDWPGDNDLENAIGLGAGSTNNASFIQFDFVPVVDSISFNFLFASEEYGQFQCTFTDAFAFLLTNNATGVTENIAIVPGTTDVVSVLNVRDDAYNPNCSSVNPQFFDAFYGPNGLPVETAPIDFRGHTVSMSAQSAVTPGISYTIKLVIADDQDTAFDAAVFFEAGSFDIGDTCDEIGLITVNAFNDSNNNDVFDTSESNFTNGTFTYEKNNDGIINSVNASNGSFTIISDNESDTYDISFAFNDDFSTCYTQTVTSFDDVNVSFGEVAQVDFPVVDNSTCQDLAVYLVNPFTSPRPGFEHTNLLIIENLSGSDIASGSIDFALDDDLLINSTAVSSPDLTISTTTTGFTVDFVNLGAGMTEVVDITLLTPVSVPLDEIVTNMATYTTDNNDTVANNNSATLSEIVIGSYDPNDKMEAQGPEILFDDFIATDEYLYYTIRFQNVGTAEAIFVRIEDVLDSQLDESTFQMLRSSHDYVVTRTENNLEWFFDNINLPAEQDDPDGSIGYVHFRIKPQPGYAIGDIISNNASIFFDFNPPIITNTFTTEFVEALSIDDFEIIGAKMYPNPADDKVSIEINSVDNFELVIFDIQGKQIALPHCIENNRIDLNLQQLGTGIYFVKLTSRGRTFMEKLVIR